MRGLKILLPRQLDRNNQVKKLHWRPVITLFMLYLVILGAQIYLYANKVFDESWSNFFLKWLPPQANAFVIWSGLAAFLLLETILIVSAFLPFKDGRVLSILFVCLGLFSGMEKQVVGNGIWQNNQAFAPREQFNIYIQDVVALGTVRKSQCFEISLSSSFCTGLEPNWHYNRYRSFVSVSKSDRVSAGILMGQVDGKRLFFSQKIDYSEIKPFLADAAQFPAFNTVISYNGDDLLLDVKAPRDGYVSFIDNWDMDWKAEVDGQSVPIELLFGTFKVGPRQRWRPPGLIQLSTGNILAGKQPAAEPAHKTPFQVSKNGRIGPHLSFQTTGTSCSTTRLGMFCAMIWRSSPSRFMRKKATTR